MEDVSRIYMPLRSNASWFGDADCRARLERQIKTYVILYDFIIFEEGRYHITAGVDGQGMQMIWPGNSYPGDRSEIRFFTPGGEFGIEFAGQRILNSTAFSSYDVDYLPIVRDAEIEFATFIRWNNDDVGDVIKKSIEDRVSKDLVGNIYKDVLPANSYLQEHILKGLYRDSLIAHFLKLPFSVDHHVSPVISLQQNNAQVQWLPEIPIAFFNYWINLKLPDFSELSWYDLCEFRETDAGVALRRMIHRISNRVKDILREAGDQRDVDHWISQEFNKELLAELSHRIKTPVGTIASICMNILPFGFIPSIIEDAKELGDDQTSWVSVVRGYKMET